MNIILLGPPGSGKGTQGDILSKRAGVPRIATGDLLREAVMNDTPLGRRAREAMDQGLLVPDEIMLGLLQEVLARPETARGIVMDGFPRTVAQAEAVDQLLAARKGKVDRVLLFAVPDKELLKRVLGRSTVEGRTDDTREAFKQRLSVYREQTAPLMDFYRRRSVLRTVDGVGSVEDIAKRVTAEAGV